VIAFACALEPEAWIAPSTHEIPLLDASPLDAAPELEVVLLHALKVTAEMAMAMATRGVLRRFTSAFRIVRSAANEPSIHITTYMRTTGTKHADCG
jgi:hypothetical protein